MSKGDGVGRREALKRTAAVVGAFSLPGVALPPAEGQAQGPGADRATRAFKLRVDAATRHRDAVRRAPVANGDEQRYPQLFASYGKGLPHSALGEVDRAAFAALVKATASGRPEDMEAVPVPGVIRLVNPCAAFAYSSEGSDPHSLPLPPPPAFASAEQAAEGCELYWQAVTRDVAFADYATDPLVGAACEEISRFEGFKGPRTAGAVSPSTIFRGSTAGDLVGPFLSQFLLKEVPYGSIRLVPHVRTATPGIDYLTNWEDWLGVQNGAATVSRHAGAYRYIRTARDLASYVQLDFSYQPFLTACLVLFGMEGTTDVRRPYKGAPYDPANPYRASKNQSGFSTYGVAHVLDLVARVANLALRHAWFHKWLVHRRLRPEELGARVHANLTGRAKYPLDESLLHATVLAQISAKYQSYLLPQAYPEGCPMHPSYPSGHATIAGACATVLKAFFDETFPIDEPVLPTPNGLALEPYAGPTLLVGNEIDKLASNVGMARNAAGIHWRSDNFAGMRLGEAVALDLLAELRPTMAEHFEGFALTTFDGVRVTV